MGADDLSRHNATSKTLVIMLKEVYAVNKLNRDRNKMFPIAMSLEKAEQDKDEKLKQLLSKPEAMACFITKEYNGINDHCLNGRIWTPGCLQSRLVEWYHNVFMHAGSSRNAGKCSANSWMEEHGKYVDKHTKTCDECQQYNIVGKPPYGLISDTGALHNKNLCEKIQIDCAGPWTVKVESVGTTGEILTFPFHILIIVDC